MKREGKPEEEVETSLPYAGLILEEERVRKDRAGRVSVWRQILESLARRMRNPFANGTCSNNFGSYMIDLYYYSHHAQSLTGRSPQEVGP